MAHLRKPSWSHIVVLCLFLALVLLVLNVVLGCPGAERAMIEYGASLQMGDTPYQARAKLEGLCCLTAVGDWSSGDMQISTPYQLGATNWMLLMRFDDRGLKSISYRDEDTGTRRPPRAPPDRRREN